MSKPELKAYNTWFMEVMPERLAELEGAVRASSSFASWHADLSPESLGPLGSWFAENLETRLRTAQELETMKAQLIFPVDVSAEQLTNRTFSFAMDVGMYVGRVILQNISGTRWNQPLRNERFVDYGQPVIMGVSTVPLNPVRMAVGFAYGIAKKRFSGDRLRAEYDALVRMHHAKQQPS